MGSEAKKTEHSGPKRGRGAYWGHKWEAKKESNRMRRENSKREIRDESTCAESESTSAKTACGQEESREGALGSLAA
jgi:hypothetical protein